MKDKLVRVLKFLAYPAFYCLALLLCGYLAFPYGRLKDRIIAEMERKGRPGERVEIDHFSSYWFTGIEASGVKIILPKEESTAMKLPTDDGKDAPPKDSVLAIDELHVRVQILPLLIGRIRVSFWVSGLGGEIKGVVPVGNAKGDVDVEFDKIDISKIEPLANAIGGVPLSGTATGHLALSPEEGKFSKASGTFELAINDLVVSDGKTKIQGIIELPAAKVGDLTLSASATDGVLTVNKLQAAGTDIELAGSGKIALHDAWRGSISDLFVRFKFTDAYRGKNEITKTLLGTPGSSTPGIIEMQVAKLKRAKRADGFYGFHVHGPLKRLQFEPTPNDSATSTSTAAPPPPVLPKMPHNARPVVEPPMPNHRPMGAGAPAAPPANPIPGLPPPIPGQRKFPGTLPNGPAAAEPAAPEPEPEPAAAPAPEPEQPAEAPEAPAE